MDGIPNVNTEERISPSNDVLADDVPLLATPDDRQDYSGYGRHDVYAPEERGGPTRYRRDMQGFLRPGQRRAERDADSRGLRL